ncbi:aldehyde dehydrogenase family protein [bacterium]|nr:aldehyde dehydrogenase family protein [bacterium]
MPYQSLNPTTEELMEVYPEIEEGALEAALDRAEAAFKSWRQTDFSSRARLLRRAADLLDNRAVAHARIMALEMGKPVGDGVAEARKCALALRYYADHGEAFLRDVYTRTDASESRVSYQPLGPILAIMPWNYPYWQVFRFAAPALMAGNVVLLKHAPNTPQCALEMVDLMREAGFPPDVFQSLFLTNDQAARVIEDRRVAGVTLTGSTAAGRKVAAAAGKALKPSVMELGGSDPFIVFPDANLEEAAKIAAFSRCLNGGQSCIAAKRFLVQESILNGFLSDFVEAMTAQVVGDPLKDETRMGPMARRDLRDGLAEQVRKSLALGARALCGGETPSGRGFFYPPTVLIDVPSHAPAATEELFGPVAVVIPFKDEADAVRIANDTTYGLGAALWTTDKERIARLVPQIEAGAVFVNGFVKSDPRLPFGGIKASGYGRELAREGMIEFMNQKAVWIR